MTTATVTLRDLRPADGDVLDELTSGLSPRSRYFRFHSPIPTLTTGMRRALLDVDGRDRVALVAETDDGTPVGIGRTIRDPLRQREAELAVAVAERARIAGARRLTPRVLPGNAAALGPVRDAFPIHLTRPDPDAHVLAVLLDPADGDWAITMKDVVADLGAA
jgi:hypothetical protein